MSSSASRRPWVWIYGLAVLVMFIAVSVFAWLAVESRRSAGASQAPPAGPIPAERFLLLAQFEPPPYPPDRAYAKVHTRPFEHAMEHYLKRDFAGAISRLRASVAAHADGPEAPFYLGICSLLSGDGDAGVKALQLVIGAGDTQYLEQARYYLAKALLRRSDIPGARVQLEGVIAMHGGLEQRSRSLLTQIAGSAPQVK